jgi:hypothetical protein
MIYEQKKNSGCGSNTFLDLDLLVNRGIGLGRMEISVGMGRVGVRLERVRFVVRSREFKEPQRIYNGSGQLIYRGAVMADQQPIPSIRLKAQRRGLQDYEYFWLLARKAGKQAADQMVNSVVYVVLLGSRLCWTLKSGKIIRTSGIKSDRCGRTPGRSKRRRHRT